MPDLGRRVPEHVLIVDVANVMGSVPDGWWKDRAAAAARLHAAVSDALGAGRLPYDRTILVLEGAARSGVPAGTSESPAGVSVVHAAGSGDDEIVAQCRGLTATGSDPDSDLSSQVRLTVATADRGLIARVSALGASVVGPRSIPRRPD